MAWKVTALCIALAVVLSVAAPARAVSPNIYDGNISTSMLDYFSDILSKVSPSKNYVLLRSSQYSYNLYVGDIDWDGNRFTSPAAEVYTISTNSGYNSYYTLNHSTVNDLSILPGDYLLYSDLGPFPGLREPVEVWGYFVVVALFVLILADLIRSIWRWRM